MAVQQAEPVALGLQVGRAVLGSWGQAAHRAHCPHHCPRQTLDAEAGAQVCIPAGLLTGCAAEGKLSLPEPQFLGVSAGLTGSFFVGGFVFHFKKFKYN